MTCDILQSRFRTKRQLKLLLVAVLSIDQMTQVDSLRLAAIRLIITVK